MMANKVPNHIFRGYDIRGVVGPELNEETVSLLAKGYATWLLHHHVPDCVIGFDCRLSSSKFREIMAHELTQAGINVYDIGMTLTQIVYFAGYYFKTKGLVMVTASHNPKEYNGFKFGTGFSETMLTDEIIELRDIVNNEKFEMQNSIGTYTKTDIKDAYITDLFNHVGQIGKFKVVIDSCASTTGVYLPEIIRRAGCEVIEQNTTPDGNFPVGTPDPTEKKVQERLARRVIVEKADLGLSYDCDGDRLGVVDEAGSIIWNDTLVSLFAKDAIDYVPQARIIYNVLCSKQVEEVIAQKGGVPIMWKTGHSFIKAKTKEEHATFGGELSGHFFFLDNFYGHDDGAIASLRLLAYLTRVNKSLKQAVDELPHYVTSPEIKLTCPDDVKFKLINGKITKEVKRLYPDASYVEIDGIRMDTKEEMLVIRASQNGPYITVKYEAKTKDAYNALKQQISKLLHSCPEIDFSKGTNTNELL